MYTLVPLIFALFMTLWAMVDQVFFDWSGLGGKDGNALLFFFGSVILVFAIWIILEGIQLAGKFSDNTKD